MSEQPQNQSNEQTQPQEQLQPDQQMQPMVPEAPVQPVLQAEQPKRISRRKFLIIGGTALGVIAVGGAAFLAGTLMNKKSNSPNGLFAGVPGSSGPVDPLGPGEQGGILDAGLFGNQIAVLRYPIKVDEILFAGDGVIGDGV